MCVTHKPTGDCRRYRADTEVYIYIIRASLCTTPPLYLDSLFLKVQGPTPPSRRVGWTFGKVQGPTPLEGPRDPPKAQQVGGKCCFSRDYYR